MGLALIVHGGAGHIPAERHEAARLGCQAAVEAGWRILRGGGSALDAVQAAIMALEDNPNFNAGTGATLTADGRIELDAGLMDGATLDVGAVAGVERVRNPIALARAVLASPHVLLIGAGAEDFSTEAGLSLVQSETMITDAQRARWLKGYQDAEAQADAALRGSETIAGGLDTGMGEPIPLNPHIHSDDDKHGTVGAVAVDLDGHIAAGASTGGLAGKRPGRVGDTPLPGAGYAAEDGIGGVSSTGHGEAFIRLMLAHRALEFIGGGMSAQQAADAAIALLGQRVSGSGGLILLDGQGQVGRARNTPAMAYAYMLQGAPDIVAGV